MANKSLFRSSSRSAVDLANARNRHGAPAYKLSNEGALAQLALTGALNQTYYADAGEQLDVVLGLCDDVDHGFIAKVAIFSRERGHMKDMPALLLAVLAARNSEWFEIVFERVVDNGRMLRTFVQIVRSGVTGRKSFGSRIKRVIRAYLDACSDETLFRMSVGNSPSLRDIIKLVHPRPRDEARAALYGYILGVDVDSEHLPKLVREFEAFKRSLNKDVPQVPFQLLTALDLRKEHWIEIAKNASWQMTRMNLNTFKRHGVFENKRMTSRIAARLENASLVKSSRVFPYQLLAAYVMATAVPHEVRRALEKALEISLANVPAFKGRVVVAPDVSGSMQSPVTGYRPGSTSVVRCIDVAALMAAAVLRQNRDARVLPFEHGVIDVDIDRNGSVLANAAKLSSIGGGGTNCSAPLARLNLDHAIVDLVIMVSDNESWVDTRGRYQTETMRQWNELKVRCPRAKLVCIDIQPHRTVQAVERWDILHVGGFSDAVFDVMARFARERNDAERWQAVIEKISLYEAAAA